MKQQAGPILPSAQRTCHCCRWAPSARKSSPPRAHRFRGSATSSDRNQMDAKPQIQDPQKSRWCHPCRPEGCGQASWRRRAMTGKAKQPLCIGGRKRRHLGKGRSSTSATRCPTSTVYAGSLRLPRCGHGARYGLSVSRMMRSSGMCGMTVFHARLFEGGHAAQAKAKRPVTCNFLDFFPSPSEAVKDPAKR